MERTEGKQLHISEIATVKCRLCATTMRRKNYKAHLKKIHPKANSDDLSGWSQPKILNMLKDAHVIQAVENLKAPGTIQGHSAAVVDVDQQAVQALPGLIDDDDSHQPCVSTGCHDLPAESDVGGGELRGDDQEDQQGISCLGGGAGILSQQNDKSS